MQNQFDSSIFRAYDIRGVYPSGLNEEVAFRIALSLAELFPLARKLAVARDPRISSPALSKAIIRGLMRAGRKVVDIGIAPDPLFYFAVLHEGFDGGVVVSGSHNPKEYNGLTLNAKKQPEQEPEDIILSDMEKIKERVFSDKPFENLSKGSSFEEKNFSEKYIDYVACKINLKKPLKIVIDSGNGACGDLPERVFKKLGCEVKTLFPDFDGNFPNHMPDPYESENLSFIKQAVLAEKADIGFAFDADGDRVAPIDNKGRQVLGDFCWLLLARQALAKKRGPLVHCMRISQAFLDEMKSKGIETYFSVSHHAAVKKKIIETGAVFGGETTYHYLFPLDYYLCDEALFSALKIAEVASGESDFSALIDSLPRYFASPEIFIETPDEQKEALIKKLQDYLKDKHYNFIDIDGARLVFENGWALARFSNTGPFIKVRFEGKTQSDLVEIEKKCLALFEQVGIPVQKEHRAILGL